MAIWTRSPVRSSPCCPDHTPDDHESRWLAALDDQRVSRRASVVSIPSHIAINQLWDRLQGEGIQVGRTTVAQALKEQTHHIVILTDFPGQGDMPIRQDRIVCHIQPITNPPIVTHLLTDSPNSAILYINVHLIYRFIF